MAASDIVPLKSIRPATSRIDSWRVFSGDPLWGLEPSEINSALLHASTPETPLAPLTMRSLFNVLEHLGPGVPDLDVIMRSREHRATYSEEQRRAADLLNNQGNLATWNSIELLSNAYSRQSLMKQWAQYREQQEPPEESMPMVQQVPPVLSMPAPFTETAPEMVAVAAASGRPVGRAA